MMQFTFHYGSILIQVDVKQHVAAQIYIPLWFYSNLLRVENNENILLFTFHYGSILIPKPLPCENFNKDLHSTMVLF